MGFKLITKGTDNHLIRADVQASFGLNGGEFEAVLDRSGLNLNKNAIPNDTLPPFRPSGVRLGTPAMTTRGLKEEHMEQVAEWMIQAIKNRDDSVQIEALARQVSEFARGFPLPSDS